MHCAHSTAHQENLHFSSVCRGGERRKSWTGCLDTELQRLFLQELVCVMRWHIFFHSCHFMLAGFLVPALSWLYFQCSSQTLSKCYDSICPVKLGNRGTTVTLIPTKSREGIISLIIITASALFRSSSGICKFCWEVTSRNYRCPQYWEFSSIVNIVVVLERFSHICCTPSFISNFYHEGFFLSSDMLWVPELSTVTFMTVKKEKDNQKFQWSGFENSWRMVFYP